MLKQNHFVFLSLSLLLTAIFLTVPDSAAYAASTVDDVSDNVIESTSRLPGLLTALSYLLALLFGATGVLKIREHVENPNQTPLRVPLIRFLAGGALLALPMMLRAAFNTFDNTMMDYLTDDTSMWRFHNNVNAIITSATGSAGDGGLNDLMRNIVGGITTLPNLVSAIGYLLALLACVSGILKIKEHVENPDRVELKEGVIRLLICGALLAAPRIIVALQNTISGVDAGEIDSTLTSILPTAANYLHSSRAAGAIDTCAEILGENEEGLGATMCLLVGRTGLSQAFLTALSYLFAVVLTLWSMLKIRDHVLNPQQTSIWEGITRLLAAGAFFTLPYIAGAIQSTVNSGSAFFTANQFSAWLRQAYISEQCASDDPQALDITMACFMRDIMTPAHIMLNHFAFIAGLVLIMIGITRIMKSAQEGARGPGGRGTIITFLVAGILLSYNQILELFTASLSVMDGTTQTDAALAYTTGMVDAEVRHVEVVMSTILQFTMIVGLISFVRGWFIVRDVAEGNQQASLMAGATHILGGALAINLGPILSAVQASLGLTGLGVTF